MKIILNTKQHLKELLTLLNHQDMDQKNLETSLKFDLYLALIALNNCHYQEKTYFQKDSIMADFLRRVNNLKIKIMLKRKKVEISTLLKEIIDKYDHYQIIIESYNKESLNIISLIRSQDPIQITMLIDKLTQVRIHLNLSFEKYNQIRKFITKNIFKSEYFLEDNNLHIQNYVIPLEQFYEVFEYLLDIDTYPQIFLNNKINRQHIIMISNFINILKKPDYSVTITCHELIPIILILLLQKDIKNLDKLDMCAFKIANIKITDLYSLASKNMPNTHLQVVKWGKITIPNNYLYTQIQDLIQRGMYYYWEEDLILENITNKVSDFKVSISLPSMIHFLNDIVSLL